MEKREIFTLSALAFSVGVVVGFLISPVKNGFGNNSGNNSGNNIKNYYYKEPSTDGE
ncbi:hypothetical protein [Mesobacillus jeotgali]|uniref:YtxH domain-containing protein n=1 Tax=Mesobacillus jeotgali TaxID=129985 RepID=A0ABY9VLC7_9BACI|nr:hypothetical protein [Mesobacillus jeotgali]WNF23425.1 hypothetical protein RH061_02630 [Mesobacillus jeotgali]